MAWQTIPFVTTGLGLVAFALAGIFYFLRFRLKQRAELIISASSKDRLEAIALTAEQFRVDVSGLPLSKQSEIVLEQIAIRRRRDLLSTVVILAIAVLLTAIAMVAMFRPGSHEQDIQDQPRHLGQNEVEVFGSPVRISSGGSAGFCAPRRVSSCVAPEHGGELVPNSGKAADLKVTQTGYASWNVVKDGPREICVEFRVSTGACEMTNFLEGRASAVERY